MTVKKCHPEESGWPLTIACHMKKSYLPVVAVVEGLSVVVAVVVVAISVVGGVEVIVALSVVAELEVESSSLPLLQAAKAAIANTKKSFFMFSVF